MPENLLDIVDQVDELEQLRRTAKCVKDFLSFATSPHSGVSVHILHPSIDSLIKAYGICQMQILQNEKDCEGFNVNELAQVLQKELRTLWQVHKSIPTIYEWYRAYQPSGEGK